jgi:hypothetical protein
MLTPHISEVNRLGKKISKIMEAEGLSLDDLLSNLDEERESYYRDHYAKT